MARGRGWELWEDAALAEAYPLHGAGWDGWATVLPGRSADAIQMRARRLGVRLSPELVSRSRARARAAGVAAAAEAERRCWEMLCDGLPPSEIDRRLGLEPGRARRLIARRWRRGKHGETTEGEA